jgi:hypothetical protein
MDMAIKLHFIGMSDFSVLDEDGRERVGGEGGRAEGNQGSPELRVSIFSTHALESLLTQIEKCCAIIPLPFSRAVRGPPSSDARSKYPKK